MHIIDSRVTLLSVKLTNPQSMNLVHTFTL